MDTVPDYKNSHIINGTECVKMIGCGYPYISRTSIEGQIWTKEDSVPSIPNGNEVNLTIVCIDPIKIDNRTLHNITIEMNGPSSIKLILSPYPVKILSSGPYDELAERLTLDFLRASVSPTPENFWILVEGWDGNIHFLDAVVIGYFRHGDGVLKPGDNEFVDKHPEWVAPFSYIVDYKYYYSLV